MDSVSFLNIPYLVVSAFGLVSGDTIMLEFGGIAGRASLYVFGIAVLGVMLSVIFLGMVVYMAVRLMQVQHEGFRHREEREYAMRARHEEQAVRAPSRWEGVVALMESQNESDWRRAIMEADIILGEVLAERGMEGETIADQLKQANRLQFTTLDTAWEAHKMRNTIAHLGEAFPLSERDARATIDQFRRVFEEFGLV